jgi:fatty acid desaturase
LQSRPQEFIERSNLRGFFALFLDWGAICTTVLVSIWLDNWIVYLISVWIIGSFQYSIGEPLLHEASHYNLFRTKKLNDSLEFLYALPFFVDMYQYRSYHTDHHYKMWSEHDHIVEDYELHGLHKEGRNMFWLWFIKPIIGYAGYFYLRFTIELNPLKSALKFLVFWAPVVSIFLYFDMIHILILYWFVPFLWSFSSFFYWSEVGEHYNTKCGTRSDVGFIKNLFHHNAGYHYIHHQYPSIPWYNLPQAHKALSPKDIDVSCGFIDTYRQMK